jgi:hypothetical protein
LDPAKDDLIRPGKKVRLVVKNGTEWEPVYTGRILNGTTNYDFKNLDTVKRTRIDLTAVDNISTLTQHKRPQGVGNISDLPWVLEGAGTPWNVNGSGNQLAVDPTVVSLNDNASALDQVAVTRDSQLGKAWVDRKNILQVWSSLPGLVAAADTFTGANSASSLNGRTTTTGGKTWSASGNMGISSNQAYKSDTSAGSALVDTGIYDGTFEIQFTTGASTSDYNGIFVRRASNNIDYIKIEQDADKFVLKKFLGGSETGLTTAFGVFAANTTYAIRVEAHGASLKVYVNNVLVHDYTITDSVLLTGTYFGFYSTIGTGYRWDNFSATRVPNLTLADADLTDIEVDYDTDRCINTVTYKYLEYDAATQDTKEVVYGPYIDQTSIDTWGPHTADFSVQGLGFNFAAHAASILAANATPTIRVKTVDMPVTTSAETLTKGLIDLYDLVVIANSQSGIDTDLRVTSLTHHITPQKWIATLGFDTVSGVATPQSYPPVQTDSNGAPEAGSVISRTGTDAMSQAFSSGSPGFNNTVYQYTGITVPAHAKRALVCFNAGARATTNAAGYWYSKYWTSAEGYVTIGAQREHNQSDPTYTFRMSHTALINVTPGVSMNFYIDASNDPGSGSDWAFHPASLHIDWIA